MSITLTDTPTEAELDAIFNGLNDFNTRDVGPAQRHALTIVVRDGEQIVGGLSGYTAWGWLYVQWLWLAESQRGQGLAGKLLEMAEAEARRRDCHGAYIDTFSPVGLKTYLKQGYIPFGQLENFPPGRTRTFLQKPL